MNVLKSKSGAVMKVALAWLTHTVRVLSKQQTVEFGVWNSLSRALSHFVSMERGYLKIKLLEKFC